MQSGVSLLTFRKNKFPDAENKLSLVGTAFPVMMTDQLLEQSVGFLMNAL